MADKVVPFVGGEIVVSKGSGAWPVELEVRDGTASPDNMVRASLTRRDALALRRAVSDLLSEDTEHDGG